MQNPSDHGETNKEKSETGKNTNSEGTPTVPMDFEDGQDVADQGVAPKSSNVPTSPTPSVQPTPPQEKIRTHKQNQLAHITIDNENLITDDEAKSFFFDQ